MQSTRTSTAPRRMKSVLGIGVLLAAVLVLALTTPAFAKTGRVGPQRLDRPGELHLAPLRAPADPAVSYGIWDAQTSGALTYSMSGDTPTLTLTATDAAGHAVWTLAGGDATAASGTLPAALVATFRSSDPNVLRSGQLIAKNADGSVRFRKNFTDKSVQPLCDSPARLVWVEVSANKVTRVYVRQGGRTRSIVMPYAPPQAAPPELAASSAAGRRLIVGTFMPSTSKRRVMTYWMRVGSAGVPVIVSHRVTDWVGASLTPSGDKAVILTSGGVGDGPNWWVSFGRFAGGMLPGNDAGEVYASQQRIFEQGGYNYSGGSVSWGARTVAVFDRSLMPLYKRTWVFDNDTSSIWFRHDASLDELAGLDNTGALTVINVDSWAIATVPGTYADAVPLGNGRLATMTPEGTLAFTANPVAGP
jgi:hypothetical protein